MDLTQINGWGYTGLQGKEQCQLSFANTVVAPEAPTQITASSLRVRLGGSSSLPLIYGKEEEELPGTRELGSLF